MKFKAQIDIMPMDQILDPQGKVVNQSLHNLGISQVEDVRIGKHVRMELVASNRQEAEQIVDSACQKLLANLIMETYSFHVEEA